MSDPIESLLDAISTGTVRFAVGEVGRPAPRPLEADLAALKAAAGRYEAGLVFERGQLVTPRADSPLKDVGRPHIVLDLDPAVTPLKVGDVSSTTFGRRLDMRVAATCACGHGEIRAHWVESWMFEPWIAPTADMAPEPAPRTA